MKRSSRCPRFPVTQATCRYTRAASDQCFEIGESTTIACSDEADEGGVGLGENGGEACHFKNTGFILIIIEETANAIENHRLRKNTCSKSIASSNK